MALITRKDLDKLTLGGCQGEGCTHEEHDEIYLHPRCHTAGVEVSYRLGTGFLRIGCVVCHKTIADVAVQGLLGPTGDVTSANPADKGGLRAALSIEDGRIRMNFGTLLSWIDMTADEAVPFANELLRKAAHLKAKGKT